MSDSQDNGSLVAMKRAFDEIKARLEQNPDYIAFVAMREALAKVEGRPANSVAAAAVGSKVERLFPEISSRGVPRREKRLTLGDFAELAIIAANRPLTARQIVQEQVRRGIPVTASKPHVSISTTLTRDARFEVVNWEGKQAWWLKDRPHPGGSEFLGESQENGAAGSDHGTPAAPSQKH